MLSWLQPERRPAYSRWPLTSTSKRVCKHERRRLVMKLREERVDIGAIDPDLRACIEAELATLPGACVIRRRGSCFSAAGTGLRFCVGGASWAGHFAGCDFSSM